MPVGPYKTFAACMAAQAKKGYSKEACQKICGKMEKMSKNGMKKGDMPPKGMMKK